MSTHEEEQKQDFHCIQDLCESCKEFDKRMNGGDVSFDIFVVCNHKKKSENDNDTAERK